MRRPAWLRWPWVSAEWADTLQERVDRLRNERDEALGQRDTAVFNREQILRQLAEADATNRRVHDRNLELGRRISQLTESDPEYAAQLERRVARLLQVGARLLSARTAQDRRADLLQRHLDDACGMPPGGLLDSAPWQPGYKAERDKQVSP